MADKKPVSFGKRMLYLLITLAVFFFFIEAILSIFYYQKRSTSKLASIEFLYSVRNMFRPKLTPYSPENQKLVRPDSSDAFNDLVTRETANSNHYQYEPWLDFRNVDYAGKYMNIENGVRKSIPDEYINPSAKDTLLVYFFGGSTTFGFNVADFETIPSYFTRLYREKFPNAKSIRVVNFGCPNYYTYQELMLFSKLIFEGKRPDIAIFFDGLNDFWFGKMLYYNQSFYSFYLRKTYFSEQPPSTTERWFTDSLRNLFKPYPGMTEKAFSDVLMDHYFKNIDAIKLASGMSHTHAYFFCQPVPFYKYPNQLKDPMVFKDTSTRFNYIYPIIEKKADSIPDFYFLGDMLQNESGYPFVDGFHYAPRIHKRIAERMLEVVANDIKGDSTKAN